MDAKERIQSEIQAMREDGQDPILEHLHMIDPYTSGNYDHYNAGRIAGLRLAIEWLRRDG